MANTDVLDNTALRNAIQVAGSSDSVTLLGSATDGYSVLTLAKRSSFTPKATPFSGYTVQGTSSTLANSAKLVNTRIYQQNVDGPYAPGVVKDLTLNYTNGGPADGGALLSVTSPAIRSITLDNIKITGVHKGWNGNGNLYMSLRSFSAGTPLNTSLTMTGVTVDVTGQNNSFRAPRKISAFQCFCGHEKAANRAAWKEVLISTIDDITWPIAPSQQGSCNHCNMTRALEKTQEVKG